MIDNNKIVSGLFFCHLVIEKAVKAHVVKSTHQIPPKSHNLIFLSEKTDLSVKENDEIFFGVLMKYQLQGRYPDYNPVVPSKEEAVEYFDKTSGDFPMAKRAIIELIKSYIDLLNREGFSIEKTFLYGSYLDNTQSEDSDIDILLVSKGIRFI